MYERLVILFVVPIEGGGGGGDDGEVALDMSGGGNESVLRDDTVDVRRFEDLYERK